MIVTGPRVTHNQQTSEYRVSVRTADVTRDLWYRLPARYGQMISDRADAALVALAIPAMSRGGRLEVRGPISPQLHYSITRYAAEVIRTMNPRLAPLHLEADYLESAGAGETSAVVSGFSGGIDSFCLVAGHYIRERPLALTLTHLLFNNVGSHGEGSAGKALADLRFARLGPAAEQIGLPLIRVDSNLGEFYTDVDFQASHTLRNSSVPLMLQRGVSSFLYASTYNLQDLRISPCYDSAYADPVLLSLISNENMRAFSADSHLTRVQKTLRVSDIEVARDHLDVCVLDGTKNCSTCWKCKRTMFTLHVAGLLHLYEKVFDTGKFMRVLPAYLREVASSNDPLIREIREFAIQRGYPLPTALVHRSIRLADFLVARLGRREQK